MYPEDLKYSSEHEWVRDPGESEGAVRVGISHFAQDALGDIVYVSLPEVGTEVTAGETVGELESTKSVSDIYAPVSGTVVEVNTELADAPQRLNEDPYGEGWICIIELAGDDRAAAEAEEPADERTDAPPAEPKVDSDWSPPPRLGATAMNRPWTSARTRNGAYSRTHEARTTSPDRCLDPRVNG